MDDNVMGSCMVLQAVYFIGDSLFVFTAGIDDSVGGASGGAIGGWLGEFVVREDTNHGGRDANHGGREMSQGTK